MTFFLGASEYRFSDLLIFLKDLDFNWLWWITLISSIFGIIGFFYGFYSRYTGKIRKLIKYQITGYNLVSEEIKKISNSVKVTINDKEIENLTLTRVAIINDGNVTIKKDDIPMEHPFEIKVDDPFELYEYELESQNDQHFKVETKRHKNKIILNFNYLEPKRGFLIKLLHSGKRSNCITVNGKIIGANKIVQSSLSSQNERDYITLNESLFGFIVMMSVLAALITFSFVTDDLSFLWGLFLSLFVYGGLFFAIRQKRRLAIPVKLQKMTEPFNEKK